MSPELSAALFVVALFSGVFIVYLGLRQRGQQLEMHHRERMAMIEKGQIPLSEPTLRQPATGVPQVKSTRSLSGGIIVVGFGLALMTVIGVAGDSPSIGIGIGGAFAVLGAAFIVRSMVVKDDASIAHDRIPE